MKPSRKLLILGAGAVTTELYLPALESLGLVSGTLLVDPRAKPLSGVEVLQADFTSFTQQVKTSGRRFDAVIVALPNSLHEAAVRWALEQNYDVLCEKPLALSSSVCEQLAIKASRAGRLLAVNMVRRKYPSYELAQRMIAAGLLGRLVRVSLTHGATYRWPAASLAPFQRESGGVLADMGVHYLDLASWWLGELTPVAYQDDWQGGVEADVQFTLKSHEGVEVAMALSRRRGLSNEVIIEGTDGRIEIGVDDAGGLYWRSNSGVAARMIPQAKAAESPTLVSSFAQQIEDFLAETQGGEATSVDANAAARTARLIEWAYASRLARTHAAPQRPVCVTGGSGFVGGHLVARLAELGHADIRVPVRGPGNCAMVARFPVALSQVSLLDPVALKATIDGCSVVYHLAYGRDGADQKQATIEGTKNVVETAIAVGCDAVVVLSTMAVFGLPEGEVDESFPYHPAYGDYGKTKAQMEQWCLKRAKTSGRTRIVVLNPTCVYGPGGATYTELPATLAKQHSFCWIDAGAGNANYVYVENLVDAMLLAAGKPEAHGQRFIVNDGVVSWREFLAPLIAPWLDQIPAYSVKELQALNKSAAPKGSLVRAARLALAHPDVRAQLRTLPLAAFASRTLPRAMIEAARAKPAAKVARARPEAATSASAGPAPANAGPAAANAGAAPIPPPVWLAELFGPCHAVFRATRAETVLGWRPQVTLLEGQRRAQEYLRWLGIC